MAKLKKKTKKPVAKAKPAKKVAVKKTAAKAKPKAKVAKPVKKGKSSAKASSSDRKSSPKAASTNWLNFFTPLDDRIVVLVEGPAEKTAGGIYIPASVEERPTQGQVLLAGRGKKDKKGRIRPMDVKAGEKVLFGTFAGMKMQLNNQDVLMLREEDIMGVVD